MEQLAQKVKKLINIQENLVCDSVHEGKQHKFKKWLVSAQT